MVRKVLVSLVVAALLLTIGMVVGRNMASPTAPEFYQIYILNVQEADGVSAITFIEDKTMTVKADQVTVWGWTNKDSGWTRLVDFTECVRDQSCSDRERIKFQPARFYPQQKGEPALIQLDRADW